MTDKSAAAIRELVDEVSAFTTRKELTNKITALIEEHYYPKEFTKWIGFNSSALYYRDVDEKWIKTRFVISENSSEEYDEYTTDELYNYWKENERC